MPKTFKDAKAWIDTYECQTEDEQELVNGFKNILDELDSEYSKIIQGKNKLIEDLEYLNKMNDEYLKSNNLVPADFCHLSHWIIHNETTKEIFEKLKNFDTWDSDPEDDGIEEWQASLNALEHNFMKMEQNQLFHKDFDGVETYFGFSDWTGYREQRSWIKMHKINNLPVCNCIKPCGWYLGHYWTHDEYLKKKGK